MRAVSIATLFLFFCSLVLAFALEVAPLPEFARDWRPLWLALVVVFWTLELTQGFRFWLAWLSGLMQDVLYGSYLGLHAMFLLLLVYAVQRFQQRLRVFPAWQQVLFLTVLFAVGQLVLFWLEVLTGTARELRQYLLPALISGLLWPWCYFMLHGLHRFLAGRPLTH